MEKVAFLITHRSSCDANNCPSGSTLTSGSMFRTAYSKCQSHCSSLLLPTIDCIMFEGFLRMGLAK